MATRLDFSFAVVVVIGQRNVAVVDSVVLVL